jgi:co-chaperonin GroES (HSP10)
MIPKTRIKATAFHPLKDNVFVTDLDSGPRKSLHGILIPDDNMTDRGIRSRWGRVWCVGPDVTDIVPGEWVLVEHGRWTTAIEFDFPDHAILVWRIEYPKAVLLAADYDPREFHSTTL